MRLKQLGVCERNEAKRKGCRKDGADRYRAEAALRDNCEHWSIITQQNEGTKYPARRVEKSLPRVIDATPLCPEAINAPI